MPYTFGTILYEHPTFLVCHLEKSRNHYIWLKVNKTNKPKILNYLPKVVNKIGICKPEMINSFFIVGHILPSLSLRVPEQ